MNGPGDIRAFADKLSSLLPDDLSPEFVLEISPPKIPDILHAVADYYGIAPETLCNMKLRSDLLCWARHVMYYLARTMTRRTLMQISMASSHCDFTVVSYGAARVAREIQINEIARDDIDILRLRVAYRVMDRCEGKTCH